MKNGGKCHRAICRDRVHSRSRVHWGSLRRKGKGSKDGEQRTHLGAQPFCTVPGTCAKNGQTHGNKVFSTHHLVWCYLGSHSRSFYCVVSSCPSLQAFCTVARSVVLSLWDSSPHSVALQIITLLFITGANLQFWSSNENSFMAGVPTTRTVLRSRCQEGWEPLL